LLRILESGGFSFETSLPAQDVDSAEGNECAEEEMASSTDATMEQKEKRTRCSLAAPPCECAPGCIANLQVPRHPQKAIESRCQGLRAPVPESQDSGCGFGSGQRDWAGLALTAVQAIDASTAPCPCTAPLTPLTLSQVQTRKKSAIWTSVSEGLPARLLSCGHQENAIRVTTKDTEI
jgi:hypothetical protein